MLGNVVDKVMNRIKNKRFLDDMKKLISEGEKQRFYLYRLNNQIKAVLFDCERLKDILVLNIEVNPIPLELTKKIDEDTFNYLRLYNDNYKSNDYFNNITKFNELVDCITDYYYRINQYKEVIEDIKYYINREKSSLKNSIVKFDFDKHKNLFCMLCDFGNHDICDIKSLFVPIFYGNFHKTHFYDKTGVMSIVIKDIYFEPHIHLASIEIRTEQKRAGIGTSILRFLESNIIPELNKRIEMFNNNVKIIDDDLKYKYIKSIKGHSGNLDSETSSYVRTKFYEKNGFTIQENNFHKILK